MAGLVLVAVLWWRLSLVQVAVIGIALACLAIALYAWCTARRMDRILARRGNPSAGQRNVGGEKHEQP